MLANQSHDRATLPHLLTERGMGWRAWNAYEEAKRERLRALPWRKRYRWPVVAVVALFLVVLAVRLALAQAPNALSTKERAAIALTAAAIVAIILETDRAAYHATGRPCACPEDLNRAGRRCGNNSAYSRPGGARPLCYPSDVSAELIEKYRAKLTGR